MDKADYGMAGVRLATYWQRRADNAVSADIGGPYGWGIDNKSGGRQTRHATGLGSRVADPYLDH